MEILETLKGTGAIRGVEIDAIDLIGEAMLELEKYRALGTVEELREAMNFKHYFDELYGEGLEVANWHQNGDFEPFDNFYEEALDWKE